MLFATPQVRVADFAAVLDYLTVRVVCDDLLALKEMLARVRRGGGGGGGGGDGGGDGGAEDREGAEGGGGAAEGASGRGSGRSRGSSGRVGGSARRRSSFTGGGHSDHRHGNGHNHNHNHNKQLHIVGLSNRYSEQHDPLESGGWRDVCLFVRVGDNRAVGPIVQVRLVLAADAAIMTAAASRAVRLDFRTALAALSIVQVRLHSSTLVDTRLHSSSRRSRTAE